ncbi:Na/Pi cotransporter family protein [Enterovirga sp.]|uniref:Na/Pi cotransporter family protein n=1 Tax=Enterovirga sp. TaxID=2026350 RepID=UPI002BFDA915|nr:Na/Pi cotransporter family protein [Enterovirga sp.]HMO28019.1 Na/Pi cotransporter family protein [Enterovirga sp.]
MQLNLIQILGLLAGGLALFLFGLELMTDGLKAIAGARLQSLLGKLTANRFRGVLAGAGVTALLNSSTITTVLLVGFVSAGLMTLGQAVPMIMGANVGSTLTAQIMAFDVSRLTPFMLALGFFSYAFAGRPLVRQLGGVVLGLGLLFLGIQFMGDATRPLRTFQPFIDAMQNMSNPLLGIAAGAIFTAVVQSSAATLGIIIALASQGLIPLESGIALILGANVGTCGTALLAAIGKPPEAAQVGVVHLLFNVFGVLLFVFIIPQFADFVRFISPAAPGLEGTARLAAETPRQVANAHTIFSVAGTLVLIWFTTPIARLAERIVPPSPADEMEKIGDPAYLDDDALILPSLGIKQVQMETERLGLHVTDLVQRGREVLLNGEGTEIEALLAREHEADRLFTAILGYLGRLSQVEHSQVEGERMIALAQVVTSLDGIGEVITTNLVGIGRRWQASGVDAAQLSDESTFAYADAVIANLGEAVRLVARPDEAVARRVVDAKAEIEKLAEAARNAVLSKLQLTSGADVSNFRLASDLIEKFKEIARLSRVIARSMQGFAPDQQGEEHHGEEKEE